MAIAFTFNKRFYLLKAHWRLECLSVSRSLLCGTCVYKHHQQARCIYRISRNNYVAIKWHTLRIDQSTCVYVKVCVSKYKNSVTVVCYLFVVIAITTIILVVVVIIVIVLSFVFVKFSSAKFGLGLYGCHQHYIVIVIQPDEQTQTFAR